MAQISKIAANAVWLSSARVLNPLTSVVLVSAIARADGAAALGRYSLVLTLFFMATSLAGLGLATPITRSIAIHPERTSKIFDGAVILSLLTALIAAITILALVKALNYPVEVAESAKVLMWAVFPSVAILHIDAIFMGQQRANIIAIASIAENIAKVTVSVSLLLSGFDIVSVFITIAVLRYIIFGVYVVYFASTVSRPFANPEIGAIRDLIKASPVFTTNLLLTTVFGRIDILLLSKLGGLADVGYYTAAQRIIEIAKLFPFSVKRASLSPLSTFFQDSREKFSELFEKLFSYLLAFGLLATLLTIVVSDLAIGLIYGDALAPAAPTLRTMAPYITFTSLTAILSCALFSSHNEKFDLTANVLKLLVLGALSITLIPRYGVSGAAISFVAAEAMLLVAMYVFLKFNIHSFALFQLTRLPLMALLPSGVTAYLLSGLNVIVQASATAVVFIAALLLLDVQVRHDTMTLLARATGKLNKK